MLSDALAAGEHIEIRDFGSFDRKTQLPRRARNPSTGEAVDVPEKFSVHFKPGQELRQRVDYPATKSPYRAHGDSLAHGHPQSLLPADPLCRSRSPLWSGFGVRG